jgi:hypothetical protein
MKPAPLTEESGVKSTFTAVIYAMLVQANELAEFAKGVRYSLQQSHPIWVNWT